MSEHDEKLTVREACRRRMPLDGADAQALEHALSMTEDERDEARAHARVLAHAYENDNRPPQRVVAASLAYPAIPSTIRQSSRRRVNRREP